MSRSLESALNDLVLAHAAGRQLALLFDYDGTLTPLVARPERAVLSHRTRSVLAGLNRSPRVRVGILSGRSLDDLTPLVRLPGLYYAGHGGLEIDLRGSRIVAPGATERRRDMQRLARRVERMAAADAGARVERKPFGFAFHYRAVARCRQEAVCAFAGRVLDPFRAEFRVVRAPAAIEVTPDVGWTKATAIQRILEHMGGAVHLLYAGDADNDEEALTEVAHAGGIAIGVGADPPAGARYRLPNPAALVRILIVLRASLRNRT